MRDSNRCGGRLRVTEITESSAWWIARLNRVDTSGVGPRIALDDQVGDVVSQP
jgi:hypothetical protein